MRIRPERAVEYVAALVELWTDRQTGPTMTHMWGTLERFQARLRGEMASVNWRDLPSAELVSLVEAYGSVTVSMNRFWPTEVVQVTPSARHFLFTHALIFTGLVDEEAGGAPYQHLPVLAAVVYATGPYVETEVNRRGAQHVGFNAALLLLMMDRSRRGGQTPSLIPNVDQVVEELKKSAWRMTPARMRDEILGQIPLTVTGRWGKLDPWEAIARSLEGLMDIAPRAIRDAIVKRTVRQEIRQGTADEGRREIEFRFVHHDDEEGADIPDWPNEIPVGGRQRQGASGAVWSSEFSAESWDPSEEAEWSRLCEAAWSDQRTRQLVQAALEGAEVQEEIARQCRVSDRTVRNWTERLRERLKG